MSREEWIAAKARGFGNYTLSKIKKLAVLGLILWVSKMTLPLITSRPPMSISESLLFLLFFSLIGGSFEGVIGWVWNDSRIDQPVRDK